MEHFEKRVGERYFIVLIALSLLVGIGAYLTITASRSAFIESVDARLLLQRLVTTTVDAETGVRGFSGTHERLFLQPYDQAKRQYPQLLAALVADLREAHLDDTLGILKSYDAEHQRWETDVLAPLISESGNQKTLQIEGKRRVDHLRMLAGEADAQLGEAAERFTRRTQLVIAAAIGLIVVLTLLLGGAAIAGMRAGVAKERQLNETITAQNDELQRSNRALEEFAYVASHDLQEPLRTVASFTELLRSRYKGSLDARADEYIEFAVDGARRMQILIDNVLDYSRVTTQGKPLEPVDLNVPLQRALRDLRARIDDCGVRVIYADLPLVMGDEAQLTGVFQNLLGNAIKYNQNADPQLRITSERDGDFVAVHVADNGIGIAPEHHERIFRIFSRLHGRGEYEGTGLGLALVKRIVERHGGRIWVDSVEGQGSTFSFTLKRGEDG